MNSFSRFSLVLFLAVLQHTSFGLEDLPRSVIASKFNYPETKLEPFAWTYMRVELPPWFSSVTLHLYSDADSEKVKLHQQTFPVLCLQEGSPPVPDASEADFVTDTNVHLNGSTGSRIQCLFFQKNITLLLTNEQIFPGVWYIGFFNGLGPSRTQAKMINRGRACLFNFDITVEQCILPGVWGANCSQVIDMLACSESSSYMGKNFLGEMFSAEDSLNHMPHVLGKYSASSYSSDNENVILCRSPQNACLRIGEGKMYSLDILDLVLQVKIAATIKSNLSLPGLVEKLQIMCYARNNAPSSQHFFDFSGDIMTTPLVIDLPKTGRWYFSIRVLQTNMSGEAKKQFTSYTLCFSVLWQVHICLSGTGGQKCAGHQYVLERFLKSSSSLPFQSFYFPVSKEMVSRSASFLINSLLTNSSLVGNSTVAWTYFHLEVPEGTAGANLHFQLSFDAKMSCRVYARYGGIPSSDTWDFAVTGIENSSKSMFLDLSALGEGRVNFYALYVKEGIWSFALMHPNNLSNEIRMSVALEECPNQCFSHGKCHSAIDASGLTLYSFCACDLNHGGFDCGMELVTPKGHVFQSVALVGSNAASILPAFRALRQKAFAEWILFTCSGLSSALYHACDVGTWCVLSFHLLQVDMLEIKQSVTLLAFISELHYWLALNFYCGLLVPVHGFLAFFYGGCEHICVHDNPEGSS